MKKKKATECNPIQHNFSSVTSSYIPGQQTIGQLGFTPVSSVKLFCTKCGKVISL